MTTELRYLQVQDSACARPMQPPARSAGLRDRIAHATSTKGKTGTSHSAKRSRTDHRTVRMRRCGLTGTYSYQTRHVHGQCTPLPPPWGDGPHSPRYQNHTKNRDTKNRAQIRTDRTKDCEIAVLWTQHRYLRLPDSAYARSIRPSTRPPGSTVRIGHTTTTTHRTDTRPRGRPCCMASLPAANEPNGLG